MDIIGQQTARLLVYLSLQDPSILAWFLTRIYEIDCLRCLLLSPRCGLRNSATTLITGIVAIPSSKLGIREAMSANKDRAPLVQFATRLLDMLYSFDPSQLELAEFFFALTHVVITYIKTPGDDDGAEASIL